MNFLKERKVKKQFKDGKILPISIIPDSLDRDRFLVNYSIANNTPILVSKQERWGDLKYTNHNVVLYRFAKNFTFEIRDIRFPNGVLVDESVEPEMIKWLKDNNIIISGGFNNEA